MQTYYLIISYNQYHILDHINSIKSHTNAFGVYDVTLMSALQQKLDLLKNKQHGLIHHQYIKFFIINNFVFIKLKT